jgi:hypothetical protein
MVVYIGLCFCAHVDLHHGIPWDCWACALRAQCSEIVRRQLLASTSSGTVIGDSAIYSKSAVKKIMFVRAIAIKWVPGGGR